MSRAARGVKANAQAGTDLFYSTLESPARTPGRAIDDELSFMDDDEEGLFDDPAPVSTGKSKSSSSSNPQAATGISSAPYGLDFHEFAPDAAPNAKSSSEAPPRKSNSFNRPSSSSGGNNNNGNNNNNNGGGGSSKKNSAVVVERRTEEDEDDGTRFWQLDYYRKFFNVDTSDILERILKSLFPIKNWLTPIARDRPDLYGPFWLATTLIFVMGVTANVSSYINFLHGKSADTPGHPTRWIYDFEYISTATILIYGFVSVVPGLLYWYCRCQDVPTRFAEIACIYGYSTAIFIPVAGLCIIPDNALRWALICVAVAMSCWHVLINLLPILNAYLPKKRLSTFIICIVGAHVLLGFVYKIYFFQYHSDFLDPGQSTPTPSVIPSVVPSVLPSPSLNGTLVSPTASLSHPAPILPSPSQ